MTDVIATIGSLLGRMQSGVRFSERERIAVAERAEVIREREAARLRAGRQKIGMPLPERDIMTHASGAADKDPVVRVHVGNEQWGQRLTVMYGVAHLATAITETNRHLATLTTQQTTVINLLQQVLDELRHARST